METDLDGDPDCDWLIPLFRGIETPLLYRFHGALVDIPVKRRDDMDVLRFALGTHHQSDDHRPGQTKPARVRFVYRRDLVGDSRRCNPRANIEYLLIVSLVTPRRRKCDPDNRE